jgi:hypothetical protein
VSTANYTCGQRETAKHLLLDYKEYRKERKDLLNRIKKGIKVRQLTLPLITHTKIGITNLLAFLKGTNIYIRKWFLERRRGERGEGKGWKGRWKGRKGWKGPKTLFNFSYLFPLFSFVLFWRESPKVKNRNN